MNGWLKSSQERSLTGSVSAGVLAQGFPTILVPGKANCAICGNQHARKPCGFMEGIFIFQDSTLSLFPCRSKRGWKGSPLLFTLVLDPIYVRSGDHLEAAKKAGYKDTHTLRNQACKLRRECADQITEELHRNFAEIAPRALNILSDLAENAESESVCLGATRDLLDRAGFRPLLIGMK